MSSDAGDDDVPDLVENFEEVAIADTKEEKSGEVAASA